MGNPAGLLLFGITALCILGIIYGTIPTAVNNCETASKEIGQAVIVGGNEKQTQEQKDQQAMEAGNAIFWCIVTGYILGWLGTIILISIAVSSAIFGIVVIKD